NPNFTPPATLATATQGKDDNNLNTTQKQQTGANPTYWVFGTELPKVVLNEVLAEATDPSPTVPGTNTEEVMLWLELLNTIQATAGGTNNTQLQDGYRIPFYMTPPGAPTGYSPYIVTVAQNLMPSLLNPAGSLLPDASANVLGKANNLGVPPYPPTATYYPLPQSTTVQEFAVAGNVKLMGGGAQPAPTNGPNVGVGIDPQGIPNVSPFFLIGPPAPVPSQ